ncbi:hypothetical protein [Blastopirellula retiformator]|uniref:Uncharacterized protein n=1 Tax=Blastopirellula retiformator TaxID=2527970 RepID=A0A5C5VLI3_9BACT|nr:hypothetical protein [Blastopirellula retiformator]TWT38705.1 hypothetical protein Enr8_03990 [Blastopirellula retiformator]
MREFITVLIGLLGSVVILFVVVVLACVASTFVVLAIRHASQPNIEVQSIEPPLSSEIPQ